MIAVDIDGVVADIVYSLSRLGAKKYGTPVISCGAQQVFGDIGKLTTEQTQNLWAATEHEPDFWLRTPPLIGDGEHLLFIEFMKSHEGVFLTNRKPSTMIQTANWMSLWQLDHWEVAHTTDKASKAAELGVKWVLEDSPHNIPLLQQTVPGTVIRDWPYNRHLEGTRVSSLGEFMELVK